jgi:hypothetical protein
VLKDIEAGCQEEKRSVLEFHVLWSRVSRVCRRLEMQSRPMYHQGGNDHTAMSRFVNYISDVRNSKHFGWDSPHAPEPVQ